MPCRRGHDREAVPSARVGDRQCVRRSAKKGDGVEACGLRTSKADGAPFIKYVDDVQHNVEGGEGLYESQRLAVTSLEERQAVRYEGTEEVLIASYVAGAGTPTQPERVSPVHQRQVRPPLECPRFIGVVEMNVCCLPTHVIVPWTYYLGASLRPPRPLHPDGAPDLSESRAQSSRAAKGLGRGPSEEPGLGVVSRRT